MRRKLISKIWTKAFKRGESPAKLIEDMGNLRGEVQITKYDPFSGRILGVSPKCNTLVNQAKSNLIRLISQGQSDWIGQIDPTQLKISKMRFSNNLSSGTPSKLLYYSIAEPSVRGCVPVAGDPGTRYAGGGNNDEITGETDATVVYEIQNIAGNYVVGATTNLKIFTFRNKTTGGGILTDNPPSHSGPDGAKNFKVELYNGATLVETIYFYDPDDLTDQHVYTRQSQNPHVVVTEPAASRIMSPNSRTDTPTFYPTASSNIITGGDNSVTYLFYDYNDGYWKFQLEEIVGATANYTKLKLVFTRGAYNVINSIVPRDGYNTGTGTSLSLRYSGMTSSDYYPTLSDVEYRDGDVDFVDDYSVTFSVNMAGQYGNGITTLGTQYVKYREAFLFNGRDDMFSALYLDSGFDFDKNPLAAFYIAWTIIAPIG